jgi:hypothetical protein
MGIEHPDITEIMRSGYLDRYYDDSDETWEEIDLWTDEW